METGQRQPAMAEDQFGTLNREFLSSCIGNVEALGSNCCLAPLAADYLNQCVQLLNDVDIANEDMGSVVNELAKRLKLISDDFGSFAEKLGQKSKKIKEDPGLPPAPPASEAVSRPLPPVANPSPSIWTVTNPVQAPPAFLSRNTDAAPASVNAAPTKPDEDPEEAQEKEAQAHEFVPVSETNSIYTTRCKVYQQLKGKFEVRGVGQLYIQKTEGESHRILIRADNSLGTILLNMKITSDIPVTLNLEKRQLLTVDPSIPCPISFLVKTPDQAQALFKAIENCKNNP